MLLVALTASFPAAAAASAPAALRSVQVDSTSAATRLTLEFDRRPDFKAFTLERPNRAVLDLRRVRLQGKWEEPSAEGLITAVRRGPQPGGGMRLVVDLAARARLKTTLLPAKGSQGPRLLLTLQGAVPAAIARSATRPAATAGNAVSTPAVVAQSTGATGPVRAAHAPGDTGRPIIVAVDAGHGGQDPGASGRRGTHEKDVVLGIARALAARINREPGMQAVLTRDGDYFLTLRQRILKARQARADLFVSVHADSVRNPDVSGASVYVLSEKGATNEQARWLAERENAADLKGGVSLDDKDPALASLLLDLSQTASISASMEAAQRVLRALDGVGQVRKPQVQQAGFVVLKSPDIPSMLVETAYISNPEDESKLRQGEHQELLAQAIFGGLRTYFEQNPPDGTRYARDRANGQTLVRSTP